MAKKVLFTASTYSHIVHFHLPYLRSFHEQGWTVHVACGGNRMVIDPADEVFHIPFVKQMTSPQNFAAAKTLRAVIKRGGYDLICTHTSLAAFFTRMALWGMKRRPKVVNMVHGYLFDGQTPFLKRGILLAAEKMTAGQTDLLLTMNRWDYDTAMRHRLGKHIENIPGIGVDFSRFDHAPAPGPRERSGISDDTFVLMYAAEFSKRKSQSTLIRAMALLPENTALILAGDGVLLEDCKQLAASLGLAGRIYFPGYITDAPAWYHDVDAVVSSSRSEGLPFNIMEAMYLGKPVVATAVKGHEDLIAHGESGLLFPYGDPEACAAQILALMASPELCKSLGSNARSDSSRYNLDCVLPIVMEKYSYLVPVRAYELTH